MKSELTQSASHRAVLIGIAGVAFVICYGTVIASLVTLWSTYALYSYGFAVPFIAAYVVWARRSQTPPVREMPDYILGIPLILAGLAMLLVGHVGTLITIQQTSLIVTLAGLVLVLFGRQAFKAYQFPIAYLLLMVPIWDLPLSHLQEPSRLMSTKIAAGFLQAVGVPVLRQDTNLVLPFVTLSVLRQCSGVNQLVALIAMVVPAAYLWLDTYIRRIALFVFALLVGYLSNGFRIALVGWLAGKGLGSGDVQVSYTHVLEGLAVSALGYVAIAGCLSLLSRSRNDGAHVPLDVTFVPSALPGTTSAPRRVWLDVAVVLVMLTAGAWPHIATSHDVPLKRGLHTLASKIDNWTVDTSQDAASTLFSGVAEDLVGAYPTPAGERRFAAVDDELVRVYRQSPASRVQLYVGYYRRQEEGKELTGDAGHMLYAASTRLLLPTESGPLTISEVISEKEGTRRGVLFWYDLNGRITSTNYGVKTYMILNGIWRQRTNGAVIMIAWEGSAGAQSDARERAIEFAQALVPIFRSHFPS